MRSRRGRTADGAKAAVRQGGVERAESRPRPKGASAAVVLHPRAARHLPWDSHRRAATPLETAKLEGVDRHMASVE